MSQLSEGLKSKIIPVVQRHGVVRAAVFGSFARGESEDGSDLDILVEFAGEKSLLDLVALELELEEVVGREVEVLTYQALHPRIREGVLREQVAIL